jgi:hypothetical protein
MGLRTSLRCDWTSDKPGDKSGRAFSPVADMLAMAKALKLAPLAGDESRKKADGEKLPGVSPCNARGVEPSPFIAEAERERNEDESRRDS